MVSRRIVHELGYADVPLGATSEDAARPRSEDVPHAQFAIGQVLRFPPRDGMVRLVVALVYDKERRSWRVQTKGGRLHAPGDLRFIGTESRIR